MRAAKVTFAARFLYVFRVSLASRVGSLHFPLTEGKGEGWRFSNFSSSLRQLLTKQRPIMSEIKNAGSKGYCLLYFFIAFFLFLVLVLGVYFYNFKFLS